MDTFTEPKALAKNPHYARQRRSTLAELTDGMIDKPIVGLIRAFNKLPYCFTMQCCYGHFVYPGQSDPRSLAPLPRGIDVGRVQYRIAYVAFCVQDSDRGRTFLEALRQVPHLDPDNIQFCCAEWFWERHVNSYALQVEPDRFKSQDEAVLDYREALKIEKTRNAFFIELDALLRREQSSAGNNQ
ncbi:MAG: hypothetical protein JW952_04690 [Candidatus Eisenbacteria bacterium]|nr:hypothetical protein [Candidatus Eisenbacteria bacterium]